MSLRSEGKKGGQIKSLGSKIEYIAINNGMSKGGETRQELAGHSAAHHKNDECADPEEYSSNPIRK